MDAPINLLVKYYIQLRNKKNQVDAEYKEKVAKLTDLMEQIERVIAARSLEEGVNSYRTEYGTVFFTNTNRCTVADWNAIIQFIKENDAYDLLTHAVKKDAVRAYIETTGEVPPGIDWQTIRTFNCRVPTAKE